MDLKLVKIADCGNDKERLVMQAVRDCNLNEYIVLDTTFDEAGIVSNKHRHVYIMPDINVYQGDFIWLFTKKGEYHTHQIKLKTITHNLVVGADAENVIVANQNGVNSKNRDDLKFQYINGSLENSRTKDKECKTVLESQGIREHVCEILEGGDDAFRKREAKYGFTII